LEYFLLFLLLLAVLVLAVIGLVRVLQRLFGEGGRTARFVPGRCRNCGELLTGLDQLCSGCHLRLSQADRLADLRITQLQLRQFHFDGLLADDIYQQLLRRIRQEQRAILHPEQAREAVKDRVPATPALSEEIMDVLPVETPLPQRQPVAPSVPRVASPAIAATPAAPETPPTPSPSVSRRSLGVLLAAFMEERNILWGELTGGLLMVGCSVALVLSLWKTLEQIPLFPFIILAAITSALFAAGRYTLHHWKLEATSRGLLVIGLLLVPLNFLVLAGLSPRATGSPVELSIKAVGVALFAILVNLATRDLFPARNADGGRWRESLLLAIAVVGISVCPLAVPRLFQLGFATENVLLVWTLVPVLLHMTMIGLLLRQRWSNASLETPLPILGFTGLVTFPLALTLGFNILWTHSQHGSVGLLFERFSILFALSGTPLLAAGLFVQRRSPASMALAGTLVALLAGLIQTAALILAWPNPALVFFVAVLNASVWTAAAFLFHFPLGHAIAILSYVVAGWVVGQDLAIGPLLGSRLEATDLITSQTGVILIVLAGVLALVAELLRRNDGWHHGRFHAAGAGVVAALSLGLVYAHVIHEPAAAALVGLATAAGCLALERRWGISWLAQASSLLLPVATLAALHWLWPARPDLWGPVLAGEALLFAVLERKWRPTVALASLLAAVVPMIAVAGQYAPVDSIGHALTAAMLSAVAIVHAVREREAGYAWLGSFVLLFGLGQAMFLVPALKLAMPGVFVFLIHSLLLLPFLFARKWDRLAAVANALCRSAQISSVAAGAILLFHIAPENLLRLTLVSVVQAAVWFLFALSERSRAWLTALQVASGGVLIFTVAWLRGSTESDLGFSRSFDLYGLGLAGLVLAWTVLRLALPANELLRAGWTTLERLVLGVLVAAVAMLIVVEITPALLRELLPARQFNERWLEQAPHFFGGLPLGPWLVLLALTAALALNLWAVRGRVGQTLLLLGLLMLAWTAPVLACQSWLETRASASALRWGLAFVFALLCPMLWWREGLSRLVPHLGIRVNHEDWDLAWSPVSLLRGCAVTVAAGVPLTITLLTMAMLLGDSVPAGPRTSSVFRTMGIVASHGIPLGVIMSGLAGYAIRERQPRYAFAGGLIAQLLVCGGFAVGVAMQHLAFTSVVWVLLSLRAALTATVWAGGWLLIANWLGRFRHSSPGRARMLPSTWWNGQIVQSIVALGLLVACVAFGLIVPGDADASLNSSYPALQDWMVAASNWLGWTTLMATVSLLVLRGVLAGERRWGLMAGLTALAAIVLLAPHIPEEHGWAFQTLLLGGAGCTWVWRAFSSRREEESDHLSVWAGANALLTVVVAGIAALWYHDRLWPAIALLLVSSSEIFMARLRRRDDWAFVGGLGVNVAASLIVWHIFDGRRLDQWFIYLLQANALAAAGVAYLWDRLRTPFAGLRSPVSFLQHTLAAALLTAPLLPATIFILVAVGEPLPRALLPTGSWLGWMALAGVTAVMLIWVKREDPEREHLFVGFAALFLGATAACTLAHWDTGNWLAFRALLASWAVLAVVLFLIKSKDRPRWAAVFGFLVICMSLRASMLDPAQPQVAALGLAILATVILALADREAHPWWKYAGFSMLTLGLAEVGFARVNPEAAAPWLHHTVALLAALTVATVGYSFGVARLLDRAGRWANAARQTGPVLGLIAVGVVILAIAQEGLHFDQITKKTPLARFETAIVLASITGLMVAGIAFAVKPWLDPFGLPESGRKLYVYGAELLLMLLFLHVRFNVPGLFPPVPATIWPFLVMAIAFIGVGLSEFFRRYHLPVLSEPLQRTGVFLPLLPLLMFWLKPPAALREPLEANIPGLAPLMKYFDSMPHHFGSYALLWFLVGLLYGWLAVTKRSYRYALIASLSANAGLWALWTQHDLSFFVHPQLWLVPLALIVLASEWYHRATLKVEVSAGLRWLGLGLLYLSSTADLFITGLGQSTLLPLALALLAVFGVLLGILLRIRSYLFLGAGFLALDVFSMIWHAAVDLEQTWIWWACGIALGAAILALFALFEKRRPQMLHLMEEMRAWK
jgi:hypothetical protein